MIAMIFISKEEELRQKLENMHGYVVVLSFYQDLR